MYPAHFAERLDHKGDAGSLNQGSSDLLRRGKNLLHDAQASPLAISAPLECMDDSDRLMERAAAHVHLADDVGQVQLGLQKVCLRCGLICWFVLLRRRFLV